MNYWIWSVTPENWEIVKKNKIWAVSNEVKTRRVSQGDFIVFYVKGTGSFKGIFKITSDWYDATEPVWEEEKSNEIHYPFQCKLDLEKIGDSVFNELVPSLNFVENKSQPAMYLRAHSIGPANYGRPINQQDYELIKKNMQELPTSVEKEEDSIQHEEVISKLEEIGLALGFEPFTDQEHTHVAKGSVVDLVWETKIANIGLLKYVFEIQSKGSKKSLITNLIQSINSPLVKKVIAVSDNKQLDVIKEQVLQMQALSESSKAMFVFLDVKHVNKIYDLLPELNNFKAKLQLS